MRAFLSKLALCAFAAGLCASGHAQQTSVKFLAPTPPMGWNSWNKFGDNIDDAIIRTQADAMVSSGMKAAGYQYVNIDEGWEGTRDAQGTLHPNKGS